MKCDQLVIVMERAKQIMNAISGKYGKRKDYLVFSSRYGQCELTSDVKKILSDFPAMIVDTPHKERALEFIKAGKNSEGKEKDNHSVQANAERSLLGKLEFRGDTFVEIRFTDRKLESIFEMQKDPLVSQEHTPQTRASIRIVLGTLEELLLRETPVKEG